LYGDGKVLLAYLKEKDLNAFLKAVELKRHTPKTITDIVQLKTHLEMIRKQGYAIGDTEHTREIKSVACPVYNNRGHAIAGVSIVGPAFRMRQKRLTKELIPALLELSRTISERLGYQGVEKQVS
jgi:DNA-binding IclR family transcriptional regulator